MLKPMMILLLLILGVAPARADWVPLKSDDGSITFRVETGAPKRMNNGWHWVWVYTASNKAAKFAADCKGHFSMTEANGSWDDAQDVAPDSMADAMARIACRNAVMQ